MSAQSNILDFQKHSGRFTKLSFAVRYALAALENQKERIACDEEFQKTFVDAVEKVAEQTSETREDIRAAIEAQLDFSESAKQILLSFALVSLCTELEVFISHLVSTILLTEPRMLKSLASSKSLTTGEILELGAYEDVVGKLHEKVIKEIIDSNARDMLVKHLGNRFGLFTESEFGFDSKTKREFFQARYGKVYDIKEGLHWGMHDLEEAFAKRHSIVHEGTLPIQDMQEIDHIASGFIWTMLFLSVKAVRKYHLAVEDRWMLIMLAAFHAIADAG